MRITGRDAGPPRNKGFSAVSKGVVEFPTERLMIMFQLVELILASPIGAFVFARLQDALYAILVLSDCDDCGFNDLGKLLFGGVLAAIVVGIGASILLRRLKDKSPAAEFVSIRPDTNNPK